MKKVYNLGTRLHTNKQCKHSKGDVDVIMSKFNTLKNIIKSKQNIECTCSMCEQSLHIEFEYKGMKLLESQITQTRHP